MKIYAGIVVYNPSIKYLNETLTSLASQCDKIILFLNSPIDLSYFSSGNILVMDQNKNEGLAHAHKKIIEFAKNEEADYLILSDQDSIYPSNYVGEMLKLDDFTIGCPSWVNLLENPTNRKKQFILKNNKMVYTAPKQNDCLAHAITSGMFINLVKIHFKLLPDDALFIDWVDNDWCWRLSSAGHKIRYNQNVLLKHRLGDDDAKIIRSNYTKRGPIRDYYIIRNAIFLLLYREYKVHIHGYLTKKILHHILFSIITDLGNVKDRIPLMIRAISHGFRGELGSYKK